jgi:hypothetical protein
MPRQLRVFDHVEDQYRVWALVRHVQAGVSSASDKTPSFQVGVAFIGKRPPGSYEEDPTRRYEIASSAPQSMSRAEERVIAPLTVTDQRAHTRHNIPVDILLETLDEKGEIGLKENTVTENISLKGATLFTTLNIPVGRFLRLTSLEYKRTVHAAVRARSTGADGISRVHVEFVEEWPL